MFALADCNNFYASCERVFRPDIQGKPVIVLSNNDGCAVARSNEAKALGIKMGDPLFKIRDIFENRSTNASAESFNAKVKAFRNQFRGVKDIPFFVYRLKTIFA